MTNLITERPSVEQLTAIFAECPTAQLLPPLGDSAWKAAASKATLSAFFRSLRQRAIDELDTPMPVLTDELYEDFFKTGTRLAFEKQYFARRLLMARPLMAVLVEPDPVMRDRFLKVAVSRLETIFSEASWTLPAHVWENPTGRDPMRIDLFAAETANQFAEAMNLIGEHLSPNFRKRIVARLHKEYFENFLNNPDKMGWATMTHNWNAVCHQGVMGAALTVVEDPKFLAQLFDATARGLRLFLSGFEKDGGTSEGPGYWGYGFGWFMELNKQLETRTRGKLSLVEGDDHVRAIAEFGPRMTLSNRFCVNFSDNSARATPRISLLQYLGERFDDPFIRAHAALAWQKTAETPLDLDAMRSDIFHLTKHALNAPAAVPAATKLPSGDTFLPALAVLVSRFEDGKGRLWEFAAKGGHNAEHHNHNDVGSYLLNINGQRMLTETGAPEYNRAFFSAKRYENIAARSLGHPVPLINGKEQPAGDSYRADVLRKSFRDKESILELDLTAAYPAEAGCAKLVRLFNLNKQASRLTVTDTFDLTTTDAVETALISETPVTVRDGVATISHDGVTIRITPTAHTLIHDVQAHPYRTHAGLEANVYRIVLKPHHLQAHVVLGYTVEVV